MCALCGEDLIFVLDNCKNIIEIFPCVCQEMEAFEKKLKESWIYEAIGLPV
jgi:hypothetical protein